MDSTMADKLAEGQIAHLEQQLSNLAREAGFALPAPPAGKKTSPALPAMWHRLAGWRSAAFAGSLLVATIAVAAWWWPTGTAAEAPASAKPLTQAVAAAPAPQDAAPAAVAAPAGLEQQLQPIARDLAALRQTVDQLRSRQEQLVRDNETLRGQLSASRDETARNNDSIEQLKVSQIQMARESLALADRLNASQMQLAGVTSSISEPKAAPEEPKMVTPEAPKLVPEIPLPRPRQSARVAQAKKPPPRPARPQVRQPQPSFPWSPR